MLDKAKNDEKQRGGERAVKWKWVVKMNSEKHCEALANKGEEKEDKGSKRKQKEKKEQRKEKNSKKWTGS